MAVLTKTGGDEQLDGIKRSLQEVITLLKNNKDPGILVVIPDHSFWLIEIK